MNRNTLKYLAVIAMTVDHISGFFLTIESPLGLTLRIIGRLTAPIMCYFIAEGFYYTSSKKKYGTRLFIFAVISQFAYSFAHGLENFNFNMIFTLFLGFLILLTYEKVDNKFIKTVTILLLIFISYFCDWRLIAPMWILSFYVLRHDEKASVLSFILISAMHIILCTVTAISYGYNWYYQMWQAGVLLFIPMMLLYNGKNGHSSFFSKWFFYAYYPLHLIVIGIFVN